jgi:hypothetical protein
MKKVEQFKKLLEHPLNRIDNLRFIKYNETFNNEVDELVTDINYFINIKYCCISNEDLEKGYSEKIRLNDLKKSINTDLAIIIYLSYNTSTKFMECFLDENILFDSNEKIKKFKKIYKHTYNHIISKLNGLNINSYIEDNFNRLVSILKINSNIVNMDREQLIDHYDNIGELKSDEEKDQDTDSLLFMLYNIGAINQLPQHLTYLTRLQPIKIKL